MAGAHASPLPLRGNLNAHDPSTIIRCNDRYYTFYTGPGIRSKWSADRIFWNEGPPVFTNAPAWTTNAVPGFDGTFWAPDIAFFNGKYHLYYSVSTWGSQVSAIGLATNPTLDPSDPTYQWTDHGPVIQSWNGAPYNTIDPAVAWDASGNLWLAFGSYWDGIHLVQLNPATGLRIAPNSTVHRLADYSSIEAACLYWRGGYYYLFVNWGSCCAGVNSTYQVRVGRSTSITGPYLDRNGVPMVLGGGTLFLEGTGRYTGPGHIGVLVESGQEWFSFHYYDANSWSPFYDAYGTAKLGLAPLRWSADGWPAFTNDWSAVYDFQTDARDARGQYYGLLLNGADTVADPDYGRVLDLNGVNQYVWLPPGVAYARTFAAVVKWRGGGPWQRIFDFGFDTSRTVMLTPASGDNLLRCDINPGGSLQLLQWNQALPTNVWTHVAVTFDGNRGVLYVNGAPVVTNNSLTHSPRDVRPQTNHLGRSKFVADAWFNGQYASFRAHARALSAAEIVAPIPTIDEPADGAVVAAGSPVAFRGRATDFMARPLAASNLTWRVEQINGGQTNLVFGPQSGVTNGVFLMPTNASGSYRFALLATDPAGRTNTVFATVTPGQPAAAWNSFYPFTTGAQDMSNGFNGVLFGGASIQTNAQRGNVLNLSGSGQYVLLPAAVGGAQTLSGWIRWNGGGNWQRIFDFGRNTSAWFFLTPRNANNRMECAITTDAANYVYAIEAPTALPTNQWVHFAVVLDGRQGVLYLNGRAVAVNNALDLLPSDLAANNNRLGRSQYPADPYLSAQLDSIRLNSRALTPAELFAPLAAITHPASDWRYHGGAAAFFAGQGLNYAEQPLPASAYTWWADFYLNESPSPAFGPIAGITNGSAVIPTNAPNSTNVYYRLSLRVTDTNGLSAVAALDIYPRLTQLDFQTVPAGLEVQFEGEPLTAPASVLTVAGMNRVLAAPSPQTLGGSNYTFVLWSHGGPATQNFLVPLTNATLTASFVRPALTAARGEGVLQLTWPDWAAPLGLFTTTNLSPPVLWTPATNAFILTHSNWLTTVPVGDTLQRFWQLRPP